MNIIDILICRSVRFQVNVYDIYVRSLYGRVCDVHVDTLFMQFNIVLHTHFVGLLSHRIELHFDSCITFSRDLKLAANCATSGG